MEQKKCETIKFSGPIEKEGKYFIAYCDQLPISGFGASKEEATEKAMKAIWLYLNTHKELGQLSEIIDRYNLITEVQYKVMNQRFEAQCPIPV